MIDEPPPEAPVPAGPAVEGSSTAAPIIVEKADGSVVIDLLALVPPTAPPVCQPDEPDPFNPEIVVCHTNEISQRLGPVIGPAEDGFASAIPRARIKLSDTAAAEANATNPSVGGWNAQGGEVRLKIDF